MSGQRDKRSSKGQILALFALTFTLMVVMVGLVIDAGYGLAQRREAQNAADFAALAGARIIAEHIGGDDVNGTDYNVQVAIEETLAANNAPEIVFGAPDGPVYVDGSGNVMGYVGNGIIPDLAVGVTVDPRRAWHTFFIGIVGLTDWSASATATARGGYAIDNPGGAFPLGIAEAFFNDRQTCSGEVSGDSSSPCKPQQLSQGNLNVPGGFGWLKFGCSGYGMGQEPPDNAGGCRNSAGFLQEEIDTGNSFGCCTRVGLPGSADKIGSLTGNVASADCNSVLGKTVTIAVWDEAGGSGSNAWYHIVGFTGFQITDCSSGARNVSGVWRQPFFNGPTTTTPGFAGQGLAIELVR